MLLSLPHELLTNVAFHLTSGSSSPPGPPSSLVSLLLTHSTINGTLAFDRNPSLYADILHETFDTGAVVRRYGKEVLGEASLAATELKSRWALLRRIRQTAQLDGDIQATTQQLKEIADDLMQVFMLLTENDGRNIGHVLEWARLPAYLNHFHQNVMIPMALEPGYPDDTPEKALHVTIAFWLDEAAYFMKQKAYATLSSAEEADPSMGEDEFHETPAQIDEKVFVTRPFALALHKFDPYFAPWTAREVPLPRSLDLSNPPPNDPHLADLRPRRRAVQMSRFNREYEICPPVLTLSASMGLMIQLDRTPCVGGLSESSSNSSTTSLNFLYPFGEAPPAAVPGQSFMVDPATDNVLRQSVPLITLPSKCHDLDVRRLLSCGDPWKGGMNALAFKGKIEGKYHGSFAFFDFAGYRDMLGGDMRTLYEGTFGQQAQQIILTERVVRVHKSVLGGTGPLINAGFPLPGMPSDHFTVCYDEDEQGPEPEGSEYTKEIYVDGTGRSGWGHFKLTGRVRPWDGMITLVKEYITVDAAGNDPSTRGKWLYRGYIMQDSRFVGCWRDSFTDCSFRGYEGSFHMRKQKDAFLVPLDPAAGSSILSHRPIPSLAVTTAAAAVHATSRPEVDSAEGLVFRKEESASSEVVASTSAVSSSSTNAVASSSSSSKTVRTTLGHVTGSVDLDLSSGPTFTPDWFMTHPQDGSSSAAAVASNSTGKIVTGLTADIDPARLLEICPTPSEQVQVDRQQPSGRGSVTQALLMKDVVEKQLKREEDDRQEERREWGAKRKAEVAWPESWGEADQVEWEMQWEEPSTGGGGSAGKRRRNGEKREER